MSREWCEEYDEHGRVSRRRAHAPQPCLDCGGYLCGSAVCRKCGEPGTQACPGKWDKTMIEAVIDGRVYVGTPAGFFIKVSRMLGYSEEWIEDQMGDDYPKGK